MTTAQTLSPQELVALRALVGRCGQRKAAALALVARGTLRRALTPGAPLRAPNVIAIRTLLTDLQESTR